MPKPRFTVTVRRVEYREHVFEVEADSREQAEEEVQASLIPDYDWHNSPVYHGDEEIMAVLEKRPVPGA